MAESKEKVFDYFYKNGIVEKGFDIKINKFLSIKDQIGFCDCVVKLVFEGGVYNPAIYEFAVKFATLLYYTNIVFESGVGMSEKINTAIYQSNAINYIRERINEGQYASLCEAANNKINFILQSSYAAADISNVIEKWINKLGVYAETLLSNKELLAIADKFKNVEEKDIVHELVKYIKEPAEK